MRHRARPKLLGVVRLPDRTRPSSARSDRSRPTRSVLSPRRTSRVAAAVAGGLVLAGGGAYAVTTLVDEPESPYAGAGPAPDRTDDRPVSRGSERPPLSPSSSPAGGPSSTSQGERNRTPAGADRAPRASKDPSSSSPSPDLPSPTQVADEAEKRADEAAPDVTGKRNGEQPRTGQQRTGQQSTKRDEAGASSPAGRRTGSRPSTPSSPPRQAPTPAGAQDAPQTALDGTLGTAYPSFDLSSDEAGSTFTCSVDGGPYEPCSSGIDLSHLGPGEHTLKVVATDRDGNSDPTPAVTTWVVRGADGLGD